MQSPFSPQDLAWQGGVRPSSVAHQYFVIEIDVLPCRRRASHYISHASTVWDQGIVLCLPKTYCLYAQSRFVALRCSPIGYLFSDVFARQNKRSHYQCLKTICICYFLCCTTEAYLAKAWNVYVQKQSWSLFCYHFQSRELRVISIDAFWLWPRPGVLPRMGN